MFLKYSLIGLGSAGVVGGGGYMIYNATKSGDENKPEDQAEATETQAHSQSQASSGAGNSAPASSSGGGSSVNENGGAGGNK